MKLTVLGAGCWGLTLAWLLTDNFDEITVWGRAQDLNEDLIKSPISGLFPPGFLERLKMSMCSWFGVS